MFTADALRIPLKIDANNLKKQKNERGNEILCYCCVAPCSEAWACVDKLHAMEIAKAVANIFLFESELIGSLENLQTTPQKKTSRDVLMASVGSEVAESEAARTEGIKMSVFLYVDFRQQLLLQK